MANQDPLPGSSSEKDDVVVEEQKDTLAVDDPSPKSELETSPIKKIHEKSITKTAEPYVSMRFSKRFMWSIGIVLVVLIAGLSAWKFGAYERLADIYNTTSVTVKVKEDDTFAVQGATVHINGVEYTTDDNGKITIARIVAGTYPVEVKKDGYNDLTSTVEVQRGDNDIKLLSLSKMTEKLYALHGVVKDYVTGDPVVNVQVTVNDQVTQTNPAGEFSVAKLKVGDYKVSLSKSGFIDAQQTVALKDDEAASQMTLVPSGQVTFVSNRDEGKRAIYVSNYDGSGQHQLITPAGGGEDFAPSISPDGKWIVFSSTRDGLKTTYGSPAARLYLASRDGKQLIKVSDDYSANTVLWSPNSQYIYYEGYSDLATSQYVRHFYTLSSRAVFDLGEGGNVAFSHGGTLATYVTSVNGQSTIHTLGLANGERKDIATKSVSYVQSVAFATDDLSLTYQVFNNNALETYQVKLANLSEQQVTNASSDARAYYPSPDGKQKLFVEQRDGKRDLYLLAADGSEKKLTSSGVVHPSLAPRWDSTGQYVVVAYQRQGENGLYIVGTKDSDPKKIVDYYDDQSAPYTY